MYDGTCVCVCVCVTVRPYKHQEQLWCRVWRASIYGSRQRIPGEGTIVQEIQMCVNAVLH
jgi:hypothetical protein